MHLPYKCKYTSSRVISLIGVNKHLIRLISLIDVVKQSLRVISHIDLKKISNNMYHQFRCK